VASRVIAVDIVIAVGIVSVHVIAVGVASAGLDVGRGDYLAPDLPLVFLFFLQLLDRFDLDPFLLVAVDEPALGVVDLASFVDVDPGQAVEVPTLFLRKRIAIVGSFC
jgi:hypothetical protein